MLGGLTVHCARPMEIHVVGVITVHCVRPIDTHVVGVLTVHCANTHGYACSFYFVNTFLKFKEKFDS